MKTLTGLALAALFILTATAHGKALRSDELAEVCKNDMGFASPCIMFIGGFTLGVKSGVGISAYVFMSGERKKVTKAEFIKISTAAATELEQFFTGCPPKGITANQIAKIWLKYLDDNPAVLHMVPGVTIPRSIKDAFPCK